MTQDMPQYLVDQARSLEQSLDMTREKAQAAAESIQKCTEEFQKKLKREIKRKRLQDRLWFETREASFSDTTPEHVYEYVSEVGILTPEQRDAMEQRPVPEEDQEMLLNMTIDYKKQLLRLREPVLQEQIRILQDLLTLTLIAPIYEHPHENPNVRAYVAFPDLDKLVLKELDLSGEMDPSCYVTLIPKSMTPSQISGELRETSERDGSNAYLVRNPSDRIKGPELIEYFFRLMKNLHNRTANTQSPAGKPAHYIFKTIDGRITGWSSKPGEVSEEFVDRMARIYISTIKPK